MVEDDGVTDLAICLVSTYLKSSRPPDSLRESQVYRDIFRQFRLLIVRKRLSVRVKYVIVDNVQNDILKQFIKI